VLARGGPTLIVGVLWRGDHLLWMPCALEPFDETF
jgi:hypothetical protein